MSKRRPSPTEARWRLNHRRQRELASLRALEAENDLFWSEHVAWARRAGVFAKLAEAILAYRRDGREG
jgi:hypothetical protein